MLCANAWDNAIRGDDSIVTVFLSTNIHARTFLTTKVTEGVVEWIDITEISPAYHAITYHPTKRRNHAQQSLAYTNYRGINLHKARTCRSYSVVVTPCRKRAWRRMAKYVDSCSPAGTGRRVPSPHQAVNADSSRLHASPCTSKLGFSSTGCIRRMLPSTRLAVVVDVCH